MPRNREQYQQLDVVPIYTYRGLNAIRRKNVREKLKKKTGNILYIWRRTVNIIHISFSNKQKKNEIVSYLKNVDGIYCTYTRLFLRID